MKWYTQNVYCLTCHKTADLRKFNFNGDGQIKFIGWCESCHKEITFTTEADTLIGWAKNKDDPFPSEDDLKFLKENRICFNPPPETTG